MDLNNLPDEVLLYSNDQFYEFIESCLGVDEMNLLKIQSTRSVRTLVKVPDIFSVLSIKCKEIVELKDSLCFVDEENKKMMIKPGVKAEFEELIAILKEKTVKKSKATKKSKVLSSFSTNSPVLNTFSSITTSSDLVDSSILSTSTITTTTSLMPISDYVQLIVESIEKFSNNNFENIILKYKDDFTIHLNQSDTSVNGHIKCSCKSTCKLPFRSNAKSFQLSHYFKHLKHSRCCLMKKKRQDSKKM